MMSGGFTKVSGAVHTLLTGYRSIAGIQEFRGSVTLLTEYRSIAGVQEFRGPGTLFLGKHFKPH